jgi:hypothetical protein
MSRRNSNPEPSRNSNGPRNSSPLGIPLPALTLGAMLDALALQALPSWGVVELQRSSDAGKELWKKMSLANVALCTAIDANDPTLIGVCHYIQERFGAFDQPALNRTMYWLIAEHGLTQKRAKEIPLADLLARLRAGQRGWGSAERLLFDEATLTITLDGKAFPIDDGKPFAIYRYIWEKSSPTKPVTNIDIRAHVKGLEAQNAIANHLKMLPPALYATIVPVPGVGKYILLPRMEK